MTLGDLLHAAMLADYTRSDGVWVVQWDGPGDAQTSPDPTETTGGSDVK